MERLVFENYEDFTCVVSDMYDIIRDNDDLNNISIISKYEEARHIIEELISLGYTIQNINIKNPEWDYEDEYVISLSNVDEGDIWCEPMIRNNGDYIEDESAVIYVLDNCSSETLKHLDSECIYEVSIGEYECNCDECEEYDEDNDGFTIDGVPVNKEEYDKYVSQFKVDENPVTTKSIFKVNGKEVDRETYEKALNELDEKYLDSIQDMLLSYFDFVNDMNQWCRLLRW